MSEQIVVTKGDTRFEIHVDGEAAGFLEYSDSDGVRELPHTVIDERFQGRGLASTLIQNVLDTTRAEGLGVLPVCPAVKRYITKKTDYVDLVPENERARFGL